ncbi:MAG: DNA-protecting protein DprA [Proteobacteria bacterium]|nr:MAG: DNA-protecting protein DprA [Pseudomonadota bacterium]
MDELTAWLTLARIPGMHAGKLPALLERHGSAAGILRAAAEPRAPDVSADLRWLEGPNRHFVTWGSPHYPALLAEIEDPPVGLFVRGDPATLSLPQLAMVGSRSPTPTGRETAHRFAAHLARCGLTITSGLAVGVDTASHEGALAAQGTTVAVCGTGLDVPYPRSNLRLAERIAEHGALVSEFPPGTPALKMHFPRRNRLISGLALGTLVVEAAVQSGSLITARLAAEQGREVFAIPGSIHNPLARGCHRLIRQGAKLVETADDIFSELKPLFAAFADKFQQTLDAAPRADALAGEPVPAVRALDKEYEILLDALGFEPAGVDLLVERTGLRADEVASMLLILELEGHIASYPGGLYVRTTRSRQ